MKTVREMRQALQKELMLWGCEKNGKYWSQPFWQIRKFTYKYIKIPYVDKE